MLNPAVIDKFLNRKLNSFDWIKDCSIKELDEALREMRPRPNFATLKLWEHQKACFLIMAELRRFMLQLDMGGGKTLLTLLMLLYRKQCGEKPRVIVFVPYITSVETWIEEVEKHAPSLKCVPLLGSSNQNLETLLNAEGDLFVICYQSAVAMVTTPVYNPKRKKKQWKMTAAEVREIFADFDMLVMDEIHKAKSASSITYRMCRAISAQCDWVFGLTGTPFGKDLTDLWPQYYLIDFGETLGPTLGFFQEAFFTKKDKFWGGGYEFKFKKRLLPVLKRTLKNCSIRYSVDEFYDMPPIEYITRRIKPAAGIAAYADRAVQQIEEIIKGGKGTGKLRVIESSYLQLRQLSSGFMTLKGEDTTKLHVKFDENPKLEFLEELIDAMPSESKMVVFHHFVYTNLLISDRLKGMKVKHARIWSGQKDPIGELQRFKREPTCRVLVINVKSGSSSLNLQGANYLVFFEQPDSAIDRQQAERRVWRPGQEKRVFIYDPLVEGTWDAKMHKANKEGYDLLKAVLDGKEKVSCRSM